MSDMTFEQVVNRLKNLSPEDAVYDKELQNYVDDVRVVGGEILSRTSDLEVAGIVALMQSVIIQYLINAGNVMLAAVLVSAISDEDFAVAVLGSLQSALGVATMEEWTR